MSVDLRALSSAWGDRLAAGDQPEVTAVICELAEHLANLRDGLTPMAWEEVILTLRSSALMPILLEDPLTRRAYHRPRGFPGDAELIDMIQTQGTRGGDLRTASMTGRTIHVANLARPGCQAVRYRRQIAAEFLRTAAVSAPRPTLLGLGVGHMREVDFRFLRDAGAAGRIVAVDHDQLALDHVRARLPSVETLCLSVDEILAGRLAGQLYDASWAVGFYNYLPDAAAERLLAHQISLVRPGGRILIGNFAKEAADRGYMEAFMDWKLVYRSEQDLERLARRADPDCATRVYREPSGQMVFLEVTRSAVARGEK